MGLIPSGLNADTFTPKSSPPRRGDFQRDEGEMAAYEDRVVAQKREEAAEPQQSAADHPRSQPPAIDQRVKDATVDEALQLVRDGEYTAEQVLDAEQRGKQRRGVIDALEG